ncbi:hypothetical protein R3P38DRAFT_2952003 [Favolaschia claudopus]|uniref:Proteophosphoglycan ppg4 n=1 Tax=Favolaschia claudopus TaxID=2862362 RepID=A0AAW0BF37_9AGAR
MSSAKARQSSLNRRHSSLNLVRKPFHSSPLAGPVLSSEDGPEEERSHSRSSSTPTLRFRTLSQPAPLPAPPPAPAPRHPPRRSSLLAIVKRPPLPYPPPPLPALPPGAAPPSIVSATNNWAPSPPLSPPRHTRSRSRSLIGGSKATTDLVGSAPGLPSFHRALTIPPPSQLPTPSTNAGNLRQVPNHLRKVSEDHWLSTIPPPRFSRLGLAAPTVVLPVPAHTSQRKSLRGEGGKRVSLLPLAPMAPPRSSSLINPTSGFTHDTDPVPTFSPVTPPRSSSLIQTDPLFSASTPPPLTRSRSRSSSSEGEGPQTPSSVAGSVVTIEDDQVDITLVTPREFERTYNDEVYDPLKSHVQLIPVRRLGHPFALAEASSTWAVKRPGQSHVKGKSFLSFGSGDSPLPSPLLSDFPSPPTTTPTLAPIPKALTAPSSPSVELYEPFFSSNTSTPPSAAMDTDTSETAAKKGGTMRRFLRSVSSFARLRQ